LVYDEDLKRELGSVLKEIATILPINVSLSNFPKCMLDKEFHNSVDDNYNSAHRYEIYYPGLARKSLF